ncbi:MAG: helix-turn-helix domain-containing protein [Cyanobacteriota bacterium]|jgi:AraC-like DNA-binding protein
MRPTSLPALERAPLLETHCYEEARTLLTRLIGSHQGELLDSSDSFFCRYYHAPLSHSSLVYLQWQGRERLNRTQPEDLYVLYLPLEGNISEAINGQDLIYSSPEVAHFFSPNQILEGHLSERGQGISFCLPSIWVKAELAKLLNYPVKKLPVFEPEIPLNSAFGQSLRQLLLFTWQATEPHSLFLPDLEQNLLTGLLQNHFHSYSSSLRSQTGAVDSCQLRLAQDFIQANLQNPISVGDIAATAGVSARSLQRVFAKALNCSPMQYLQTARLQALRADLQDKSHPGGVSDLMLKYQFNHFGRCSQLYYRQFGEYPSRTRRS